MPPTLTFRHVSYRWGEAAALAGDEVALFLHRSSPLGAGRHLTNYAGRNMPVKIQATGPPVEVADGGGGMAFVR